MRERSTFDPEAPKEIDLDSKDESVVLRAERIMGDSFEADQGEKREFLLSEFTKKAIEEKDTKAIEVIRRLLEASEGAELGGKKESREENLKIAMMVSKNADMLTSEQKETVLVRVRKINEVLMGVANIDEGIVDSTFIAIDNSVGAAGYVSKFSYDKSKPYVFLRPKSLEINSIIDHELLHTLQHENCPKGLIESLTCYFAAKVESGVKEMRSIRSRQSARYRRPLPSDPYFVDYLLGLSLSRIVGEDALQEIYFKGNVSVFTERYNQKAGKNNLSKRMLQFQRATEVQRNISRIENKLKRRAASLINLARKLNILMELHLDTLK